MILHIFRFNSLVLNCLSTYNRKIISLFIYNDFIYRGKIYTKMWTEAWLPKVATDLVIFKTFIHIGLFFFFNY